MTRERERIDEAQRREKHWRRWGPYVSDRAWGTVREDYSEFGTAWDHLPHDHARSKAYRWGEDGIFGICDNHQRLCFALAVWNGRDPILKERYFGVNGNEGNHGEDVKEIYYYLDSTPTHSYMKALYKYPQREYPYARIMEETRRRGREHFEYELLDTGVFDENRYWDIFTEYAKSSADDLVIRFTVHNRGPEEATIHLLPTLWFRNTWSWGRGHARPDLRLDDGGVTAQHAELGTYRLTGDTPREWLFTENETNTERFWNYRSGNGYYKDGFHERLIHGRGGAVNPAARGTKACAWYDLTVAAGQWRAVEMRLAKQAGADSIAQVFGERIQEADEYYAFIPAAAGPDAALVERQAIAGLLWSKQFFHYVVEDWLAGDPGQPPPPERRKTGRNAGWIHLYNDDVLTMPDKWEYPWFAAWDAAFHAITLAMVDPDFAKTELSRFLREWYMHPNGQIPAYEWALEDVNPPVHAWACWRVYKIDGKLNGVHDYRFLEASFHKLLMNFTWWVNRKDQANNNIFEGGFLGLDNIGVFDRSKQLPTGGYLEQSDGTAWMAMYCLNMLRIALELAQTDVVYEDIASKFFEHFLHIASAMNSPKAGLWDETDGFYYDRLKFPDGRMQTLKVRSMVGLIPLFAVDTIPAAVLHNLPGFKRRMDWFLANRPDLARNIASVTAEGVEDRRLLALVQRDRLARLLARMLDETEFLSPYGIRSLSRYHKDKPFELPVNGDIHRVGYEPAESQTGLFGGNSNWRGPVWFPVNYLMIESLQKFHHYFGADFTVEFPTGSGNRVTLGDLAAELSRRLARLFLRGSDGRRPCHGWVPKLQDDPHFRDHILFFEYFHGENGAGLGASHQTGWTSLVAKLIQQSGV